LFVFLIQIYGDNTNPTSGMDKGFHFFTTSEHIMKSMHVEIFIFKTHIA